MTWEEVIFGCDDEGNPATTTRCSDALSDSDFIYGSTTYTVNRLFDDSSTKSRNIHLLPKSLRWTSLRNAGTVLYIDGRSYSLLSGNVSQHSIQFRARPAWAAGQKVKLSLRIPEGPPENLRVTSSNSAARVSWDAVSGASGYEVQYRPYYRNPRFRGWSQACDSNSREQPAGCYFQATNISGTYYTITEYLHPGITYEVRVRTTGGAWSLLPVRFTVDYTLSPSERAADPEIGLEASRLRTSLNRISGVGVSNMGGLEIPDPPADPNVRDASGSTSDVRDTTGIVSFRCLPHR